MEKFKFFLDFEKEESWLEEMGSQGYELIGKSLLFYRFRKANEETNPMIKIDFRTFRKQRDFDDYCALFEDSGWKHIAGTKSSGVQYFKEMTESAREDIFSDVSSKAGRYKRLADMYIMLVFLYLPIFVSLITSGAIDVEALLHPKQLYYTQGLWEATGAEFWGAFLFETPFALLRGITWWIFPIFIGASLVFALKAEWQYRKGRGR
jgi:hypothetical protein